MPVFRQLWWGLRGAAFAAALTLALFYSPQSPAGPAPRLKIPTAASLSFSEKHYLGDQGRWISEYRDQLTGYLLTIAEGPGPGVREETVVNPAGELLLHAEIHPDWRRTEGYFPKPWATEIHALAGGSFFVTDRRQGTDGHTTTTERIAGQELFKDCKDPKPLTDTELDLLLKSTSQIVQLTPAAADSGKDTVHLGSNVVAKHCGSYPPSGPSGGVDKLTKDLSQALDQGMRCLANLGKTHPGKLTAMWRMHVAQLLGYFSAAAPRPFSIVCERTDAAAPSGQSDHMLKELSKSSGTDALALTCKNGTPELSGSVDDFPGMALNLAGPDINNGPMMVGTMFHEMLHHLGYNHNIDETKKPFFDAVYGAEFCCFPATLTGSDPGLSSFECDEIVKYPHGAKH